MRWTCDGDYDCGDSRDSDETPELCSGHIRKYIFHECHLRITDYNIFLWLTYLIYINISNILSKG